MFSKMAMATCLALTASGCVYPNYVASREMAYRDCNEKTSIEWADKHSHGPSATELGLEVEQKCRNEARLDVSLNNQLLTALENATRIESASLSR